MEFKIEGAVTAVNPKLLTLELNKVTIHLVLLFAEDPSLKLPGIGATVKISALFYTFKAGHTLAVLTSRKQIEGEFTLTPELQFPQIVKNLNLTPSDLLRVANNHSYVRTQFTNDVILSVVQKLQHSRFELQLIKDLIFVDYNRSRYKGFSYWTYGIHWNWSEEKYLLAYLTVGKANGILNLTDFNRSFVCLITNQTDITQFINCYVLIKDYTVVNEIYYSESEECSFKKCHILEYVVVDQSKIIKLDLDRNEDISCFGDVPNFVGNKMDFKIISKTMPIADTLDERSFWVEVSSETKHFLLRLKLFDIYPLLRIGCRYEMHHTYPLKKTYDKEIFKMFVKVPQAEPSGQVFFKPLPSPTSNILTASDASKKLQSPELQTFQGVIILKKFVNPLSSRTVSIARDDILYGTQGHKTHILVFKTDGGTLDVFLNNWENLQGPYGLIPGMRVIVRNVKAQSGRYFKSTIITSFEVISYEPEIKIETADLNGSDWGLTSYLSLGVAISVGVILNAKIVSYTVLSLKIWKEEETLLLVPHITIAAMDPMGESKIVAKNNAGLVLLRLILGLYEPAFQSWCERFLLVGDFHYYLGKQVTDELGTDEKSAAKKLLTRHINTVNMHKIGLNLLCRKMDNEANGKPVYCLVDGRF